MIHIFQLILLTLAIEFHVDRVNIEEVHCVIMIALELEWSIVE